MCCTLRSFHWWARLTITLAVFPQPPGRAIILLVCLIIFSSPHGRSPFRVMLALVGAVCMLSGLCLLGPAKRISEGVDMQHVQEQDGTVLQGFCTSSLWEGTCRRTEVSHVGEGGSATYKGDKRHVLGKIYTGLLLGGTCSNRTKVEQLTGGGQSANAQEGGGQSSVVSMLGSECHCCAGSCRWRMEMVPAIFFVPGGVPPKISIPPGHALRWGNNSFHYTPPVYFKGLHLCYISVGCLLCCFFKGRDSVSSHPASSPRDKPTGFSNSGF